MFFGLRNQLTIELGGKAGKEFVNGIQSVVDPVDLNLIPPGLQALVLGRELTSVINQSEVALGGQYVYAITSRTSVQLNAFVLDHVSGGDFGWGLAVGTRTRW
jgi:hypothetical protein